MKIDPRQKYPDEKFSKVTIYTANKAYGKVIQFPKGHPQNPLTEGEMFFKFNDCLGVLYNRETKVWIYDFLSNLENRDYMELERILMKVRRSEEHTSELQSRFDIVCRLL